MLTQTPSCIAVDWGTSRLRLWALDAAGQILCERRSEEGLEGARLNGFHAILEHHLSSLGIAMDVPVVICGMAGSRQGWVEAPYLATPTPLHLVIHHAVRVPEGPRDVRILPGLAQHSSVNPQVMRGEETKLLGLDLAGQRALVCMPGTHSKWAHIDQGAVTGFTTYLTGELFALLYDQSILRHSICGHHQVSSDNQHFIKACTAMLEAPQQLTEKLFAIRASSLLFHTTPEAAAATLSGLLIGAEVGSARLTYGTQGALTIAATGTLGKLCVKAITLAGFEFSHIDSEVSVRAGLLRAAQTFWPSRFITRSPA